MPFKNPHPLYSVWQGMRRRCDNPNHKAFPDYGGRGISVCSEWDDFHVFLRDMGPRPNGHSIDRRDNDRGYSPDNCRWATRKEQQRNQRRAVYVTIEGTEHRAIDLADMTGMKTDTIVARASKGLTYKEVVDPQPRRDLSGFALGGKASGALRKAKTHCPQGHEYTEDNLLKNKHGHRGCKTCHRDREYAKRHTMKDV